MDYVDQWSPLCLLNFGLFIHWKSIVSNRIMVTISNSNNNNRAQAFKIFHCQWIELFRLFLEWCPFTFILNESTIYCSENAFFWLMSSFYRIEIIRTMGLMVDCKPIKNCLKYLQKPGRHKLHHGSFGVHFARTNQLSFIPI